MGMIKIHRTRLIAAAEKPNLATVRVNLYLYNAIEGNKKVNTLTINKLIDQNMWTRKLFSGKTPHIIMANAQ
jgi:hypothetical protein